jgi:hypothetical protein
MLGRPTRGATSNSSTLVARANRRTVPVARPSLRQIALMPTLPADSGHAETGLLGAVVGVY